MQPRSTSSSTTRRTARRDAQLVVAGSSPRLAGSENSRCETGSLRSLVLPRALDTAVRPLRAATTWLDDARALVKRHPTIYFRAEKSNVAETELGVTMALRS